MIVTTVKPRAAALCICADPSYSVGGVYPAGESDGRPNGMRQDIGAEGDRTIANARERDRSRKGTHSAPQQPRRAKGAKVDSPGLSRKEKGPVPRAFSVAGAGFEPADLRVMSRLDHVHALRRL